MHGLYTERPCLCQLYTKSPEINIYFTFFSYGLELAFLCHILINVVIMAKYLLHYVALISILVFVSNSLQDLTCSLPRKTLVPLL